MTDGVVVLDTDGRVVDYNQAAIDVTCYKGDNPTGISIWDIYKDLPPSLIQHLQRQADHQVELEIPSNPHHYLDVKIDSIGAGNKDIQGQVLTIRDITARKLAEIEEREQRLFSEALMEITAVLNGSLNLDNVLDKILENVNKVVPHDTANIALVDNDGNIRFNKIKGYEKYGSCDALLAFECQLNDIPNMQRMARLAALHSIRILIWILNG